MKYLTTYTGSQGSEKELNPLGQVLYTVSEGLKGPSVKAESYTDLSYPQGGHSGTEYFAFSYTMLFNFLIEMTAAEESAQIFVCDNSMNSWVYDVDQVILIYTDFERWRKRRKNFNNVKPIVFAHVSLLELLYPTSYSCSEVNDELYAYFDNYSLVMGDQSNLITMNFFKNMGTILSNVVQLDSCFEEWDGECAGRRLGQTIFHLLDPSILD